ncbi:hypothetical protein [Kitasatospora griseola]|uniref:hypothetical protein n=1 Tax=Kitasatospora griseola TaxID=2064 RepID=UPI00344A07AB
MSGTNRATALASSTGGALLRAHHWLHRAAHRHLATQEEAKKGRRTVWAVGSFFAAGTCASLAYLAVVGLGAEASTARRIAIAVWLPVLAGLVVWPLVEPGTFKRSWVLGFPIVGALLGLALSALFV